MNADALKCRPEQIELFARVLRGEVKPTGSTRRGTDGKAVREFAPNIAREIETATRGLVSDWKVMRAALEEAHDILTEIDGQTEIELAIRIDAMLGR